jgi:hypothetical protein
MPPPCPLPPCSPEVHLSDLLPQTAIALVLLSWIDTMLPTLTLVEIHMLLLRRGPATATAVAAALESGTGGVGRAPSGAAATVAAVVLRVLSETRCRVPHLLLLQGGASPAHGHCSGSLLNAERGGLRADTGVERAVMRWISAAQASRGVCSQGW